MSAPTDVGHVIAGKYRIERVLGQGGMGVVVAARHIPLDEPVAIKFLLPEARSDAAVVARFLREGRAAAKIKSEHVARVYDVGTLESGVPYLVIEYLEGSDLAALVNERGPLPMDTAALYTLQVCEALAEAHAQGIIHRDIKPANLFLTARPDGSPSVKLIDFGISKLAPASAADPRLTKTLEARGSPLFMSPEQLMSARDADARSDVWSLGVTLYYLLTGSYPLQAATLPELCGLILKGAPVPLRERRPDLPVALESCVMRCLQREPAARPASVAELARLLSSFAPPQARSSAERAARVLRVAGRPDHVMSPPGPAGDTGPCSVVEPQRTVKMAPFSAPVASDAQGDAAAPGCSRRPERGPDANQGSEVQPAGDGQGSSPPAVPSPEPRDGSLSGAVTPIRDMQRAGGSERLSERLSARLSARRLAAIAAGGLGVLAAILILVGLQARSESPRTPANANANANASANTNTNTNATANANANVGLSATGPVLPQRSPVPAAPTTDAPSPAGSSPGGDVRAPAAASAGLDAPPGPPPRASSAVTSPEPTSVQRAAPRTRAPEHRAPAAKSVRPVPNPKDLFNSPN